MAWVLNGRNVSNISESAGMALMIQWKALQAGSSCWK